MCLINSRMAFLGNHVSVIIEGTWFCFFWTMKSLCLLESHYVHALLYYLPLSCQTEADVQKKRVRIWSWFQELLNFPVSFLLLKLPACLRKTPWLLCYEWLFNTWYILKWWKWVIVLKLNNLIVRHLFFLLSYILGWYCSFLLWKASDILQASEHLPVGCRISMST